MLFFLGKLLLVKIVHAEVQERGRAMQKVMWNLAEGKGRRCGRASRSSWCGWVRNAAAERRELVQRIFAESRESRNFLRVLLYRRDEKDASLGTRCENVHLPPIFLRLGSSKNPDVPSSPTLPIRISRN